MIRYTLEEIQTDIVSFQSSIQSFNLKYAALFDTLHTFGFRVGEVTTSERWNLSKYPEIEIITEKGSNNRILQVADFNSYVQEALSNNLFPFPFTSPSVSSYFVKAYYPVNQIFVQDKIITTHIFRHAKFKQLFQDGQTIEQIATYMGEKSLNNAWGYVNSIIMHS